MPGEIRDTRMIQKAFEQRWPIKPEYRAALLARMMRIVADPSSSPREATAAAKALIAAEKQNQDDEHKFIDVTLQARDAELSSIAADLGIEVGAIENATREGSPSDLRVEEHQRKTEQ